MPLADHVEALKVYSKQLKLYAASEAIDYKPFALLKIVYGNGREEIPKWKTSEMYRFLSDDDFLLVNLSEPNYLEQAEHYFSKLTMDKDMEGVVIKPEIWDGSTVPFMKVRNSDYLSLVYGYDYRFPHKYNKLLKQKNINNKLRASKKEYQLGQRMLEVPFKEIDAKHATYENIVMSMLFEEKQEIQIDPRL